MNGHMNFDDITKKTMNILQIDIFNVPINVEIISSETGISQVYNIGLEAFKYLDNPYIMHRLNTIGMFKDYISHLLSILNTHFCQVLSYNNTLHLFIPDFWNEDDRNDFVNIVKDVCSNKNLNVTIKVGYKSEFLDTNLWGQFWINGTLEKTPFIIYGSGEHDYKFSNTPETLLYSKGYPKPTDMIGLSGKFLHSCNEYPWNAIWKFKMSLYRGSTFDTSTHEDTKEYRLDRKSIILSVLTGFHKVEYDTKLFYDILSPNFNKIKLWFACD